MDAAKSAAPFNLVVSHTINNEAKVNKNISSVFLFFIMAVQVVSVSAQEIHDERISLGLTSAEKAQFLSEMRQMLASIQGVVAGIGAEDRVLIMKSARYSGNRMARATPDSVRQKLPQAFKELGGPTHMMFEELVIRAETDDMDMLSELTGQLMKQCLACHAMFKVDGK
jgi:hypothetical protein